MLYLGDTSLTTAACYLAGVMHHAGFSFTYRPSSHVLRADDLQAAGKLLILSDYPASRVSPALMQQIVEQHQYGMNLLMIGGWESFQGLDGKWQGTPVGDLLPVIMQPTDDRMNVDGPAFVRCHGNHAITRDLPWDSRPPLIGGFNRVTAKQDAHTLLSVDLNTACRTPTGMELQLQSTHPLLVVREQGPGRIACLMTDLAPHWVGPLVDWGPGRVASQAPEAEAIEVGDCYARFIGQLINWLREEFLQFRAP